MKILVQVDRGFVAQVADVVGGRSAPMNEEQREEAVKTVVGEFSDVKHVRGILSMGRLVFLGNHSPNSLVLINLFALWFFFVCAVLSGEVFEN